MVVVAVSPMFVPSVTAAYKLPFLVNVIWAVPATLYHLLAVNVPLAATFPPLQLVTVPVKLSPHNVAALFVLVATVDFM